MLVMPATHLARLEPVDEVVSRLRILRIRAPSGHTTAGEMNMNKNKPNAPA